MCLNGINYIVAPITLIVPGVLNGSKGPVYYSKEEIESSCFLWENIPIVVNHPNINGKDVSCFTDGILEKYGIGYIKNCYIDLHGKLKAYGYFSIEKTKMVDINIYNKLINRKKIEVSTGLSAELEEVIGNKDYNGVTYTHTTHNYIPDHLAVLTKQIGACSISDGCGINNAINHVYLNNVEEVSMNLTKEQRNSLVTFIVTNCDCWKEEDDKNILSNMSDNKLIKIKDEIIKSANMRAVANAAVKGFSDSDGISFRLNPETNKWEKSTSINRDEKVDSSSTQTVQNKKKEEKKEDKKEEKKIDPNDWYASAPIEVQNELRQARMLNDREKERLINELIIYIPDNEKYQHRERLKNRTIEELTNDLALVPRNHEKQTKRKQAVNNDNNEDMLIIPSISWTEIKDNSHTLSSTKEVYNTASQCDVDDNEDEWLKNAPSKVKQIFHNAAAIEQQEKRKLIDELTAHITDEEEEKRVISLLNSKTLSELKDISLIAPPKKSNRDNYFGSNTPVFNNNRVFNTNGSSIDDILEIPKIDWSEVSNNNKR